jgi:hypothetical protein
VLQCSLLVRCLLELSAVFSDVSVTSAVDGRLDIFRQPVHIYLGTEFDGIT